MGVRLVERPVGHARMVEEDRIVEIPPAALRAEGRAPHPAAPGTMQYLHRREESPVQVLAQARGPLCGQIVATIGVLRDTIRDPGVESGARGVLARRRD